MNRREFLTTVFGAAAVLPIITEPIKPDVRKMAAELCEMYRAASTEKRARMRTEMYSTANSMSVQGGESFRDFTTKIVEYYGKLH